MDESRARDDHHQSMIDHLDQELKEITKEKVALSIQQDQITKKDNYLSKMNGDQF